MKTAIIHDWLVTYAGAEKVLQEIIRLFPESHLFSIVDFLPEEFRPQILNKKARTSFIQKLPGARKGYRSYLALMPLAIEQFDLGQYDLVISCSHAVAKGVLTSGNQTHICYCFTPMRYAWDLYHTYLGDSGLDRGLKGFMARGILHYMRLWDSQTALRVNHFITPSNYVAERVKKIYRRGSTVIYPPVDVNQFQPGGPKKDFFLTASRMVPYKKLGLIVRAFSELGMPLVVVGEGPDSKKIRKAAGKNIIFKGFLPRQDLIGLMQKARAFVYAADEDFGILPLEAQACGTPVIAYGRGGLLETIQEGTGILFMEQTVEALKNAILEFHKAERSFDPALVRANAEKFSTERFVQEFSDFINAVLI